MAKELFPTTTKTYLQNDRSNVSPLGNIWSSLNLDLQSNLGVLRISPRLKLNTATQGCPVAFARYGARIYALAGTTIYRNTDSSGLPNDAFVADSSTSFSTDYSSDVSDMLGSWNVLFATAPTKLRKLSASTGGTWSDVATISTGLNHKLVYFKKFDRLYFSDQTIKSVNEAGTVVATGDYSLPGANTFGIVDMKTTSGYIWIGGKDESTLDNAAAVWQWDGISQQVTNAFTLPGSRAVVALCIDPTRDIPFALSDQGILYAFGGGGFVEVGRLPYTITNLPYMGAAPYTTQNNDRFVHPNGMIFTPWNTVRVLVNGINGNNAGTQNENLASGIWEWSKDFGFIHIGNPSYDPISDSITDFGQERILRAGALANMNVSSTISGRDGTMLVGASYYTNASSSTHAIFYDNSNDTIQKKGYFVTDWFESKDLADQWGTWWASYRRFLAATDNIVFKYRIYEEAPVEGTITWVDTTHFTVANSAVVVSDYWTEGTGGEVEILRGTGGSSCAHITSAVLAGGTWTVTLDEVITGVTNGTATARFQKWVKINPADPMDQLRAFNQWAIDTDSTPRIQIKGCFTFTGAGEYYKGVLTSNPDIKTS